MAHETDDDELFEDGGEDGGLDPELLKDLQDRRAELLQVTTKLVAAHIANHGGLPGGDYRKKALGEYSQLAIELIALADEAFDSGVQDALAEQVLGGGEDEEPEGELP